MLTLNLLSRSALVALILSVSAQAAVFIKIGDIKGESQAAGHEEEIDVLSWSWGVERPSTGETGSGRTRSTPKVLDLAISKSLEKATPKLVEACVNGNVIPEAVLMVDRPGQSGSAQLVLEIRLTNVLITSDSLAGATDVIETVTLNFETIEMIYTARNPDGSEAGKVEMSYNVEEGI